MTTGNEQRTVTMADKKMGGSDVLKELTDAAERFVNKAPKQAKLEQDRQALLDAIMRAQLVLSVGQSSGEKPHDSISERRTSPNRTSRQKRLKLVRKSE
jgi:hypothetical protein